MDASRQALNGPEDPAVGMLIADAARPVDDDDLEDRVWMSVCDWFDRQERDGLVADWYWSRLCIWDTMNGGVAQTVSNYLSELPRMVAAWRAFGKHELADIYEAARQHALRLGVDPNGEENPYDRISDQFDDFDDQVGEHEDGLDRMHIELIRAHREQFLAALRG